jgi:hypothetical protein
VSDSLTEVRQLLAGVAEQLGSAYQHAGLARSRIAAAVQVLDGLDRGHPEPLVPPELRKAAEELDRGLTLISGGVAAVADIDARL